MASNPTTIANFDTYPSSVVPQPQLIGGAIRRSLDGTGRRKIVATKQKLTLGFNSIDGDTRATLAVIFSIASNGPVTIVNSDYGINSSFLLADPAWNFQPQEGPGYLYSGSLTFEEV